MNRLTRDCSAPSAVVSFFLSLWASPQPLSSSFQPSPGSFSSPPSQALSTFGFSGCHLCQVTPNILRFPAELPPFIWQGSLAIPVPRTLSIIYGHLFKCRRGCMIVSLESEKSIPPCKRYEHRLPPTGRRSSLPERMLATQPEDLSSILRIHMEERQK